MDMDGSDDMPSGPLTTAGVNFSDPDQAADFLDDLLNDDELKIIGNAYARYFWYGIVVVVGLAAVFYWTRTIVLRWRIRAAARGVQSPAKPKSILLTCLATCTALGREATYLQWTPTRRFTWLRVPPMGTILMLLSYLVFVLALEFINNDVAGAQFWQARGVRAGWLAVAQLPLIILLVGKNNLITLATGISVERLNVLHRWAGRMMLLMAILHFGLQARAWSMYYVFNLEWTTDSCVPTGLAAFAILLWINVSTVAPFRHWSYEFFVVQHVITWFGFVVAIMYHLPSTALWSRIYVYIPIGLYLLDRIIRTALFAINNRKGTRATLTPLDGGATKVTVKSSPIKRWSPGSYVLLSMPKLGWIQAHPATIMSTPKSHGGDMVFILKSHKGFTHRLLASAKESNEALLPHTQQESRAQRNADVAQHWTTFNGPYGGQHADFAAFDSVCLIAGSTGCTFTLAALQDIADRAADSEKRLPLRRMHFIWCIKQTSCARWISNEIATAVAKLRSAGIEVVVSIYVTCSDAFTDEGPEPKECGCQCDKSLGPCCCVAVDEADGESGSDDVSVAATPMEAPTTVDKGKEAVAEVSEKDGSPSTSRATSTLEVGRQLPTKLSLLPCADFYSGRPVIAEVLTELLEGADGESAIGVCGPVALSSMVRNNVVRISDQRAIHKGTGAQGCYLHVESFS